MAAWRSWTGVVARLATIALIVSSAVGTDPPRGAPPPYTVIDLGTFGTVQSAEAFDVNDAGQVVGRASNRAFLWQNGTKTDPDTYESFYRAFIYENGVMTALPVPSWEAYAGDINDAGVVVGTLRAGGGVSNYHGWVYVDGVVTNLNTLIPAGSGLHIAYANAINNAGQIAATAFDDRGRYHAVLLTPGEGPPPTPTVSIGDVTVFEGTPAPGPPACCCRSDR